MASLLTFNKVSISLLILTCLASTLASGIEMRSMDSYRVDPLSETWRWQRIRGLETGDIVLAEMAPDGTLGIVSSPNRFRIYDGFQSELVEFPDDLMLNEINALAITSKGMYCLAASNAIVLYDGENWRQVVDSGLSQRATDVIIETPDGSLWAGLDNGLARIDPLTGHSEITRLPKAVMSLCAGQDGNSIWVSLAPYGEVWECPIRDGRLVSAEEWLQRRSALKSEVLSTSLLRASDGRTWFINDHYNLPTSVFDPATGSWEDINLSNLGGDNFDFSILETPDGAIWISSRGSLHILKNGKWTVYHSPEYPLPGARSTMVQDTVGTVTIIEASGMNVQVDYGQRQGLSFENLHFQDETAAGELLFISIDDEVVHWTKGAQEASFHSADETGITSPTALLVHSNGDWILSGSNSRQATVSIYDGTRWQAIAFPEIGLSFGHLAVLERPNGEVWLGCAQLEVEFPDFEGGIVVLKPNGAGGYSITKRQPTAYSFRNWSLQQDASGRVFTSGNGLFQNTDAGAVPIELPDLIRYKWIDQIALDSIGDIWTAIWSIGVFRLHDGNWTQFSEANGLESNLTSFVISLGGADPVVSTREGHYRFDGQGWAPFMGNMDGLHRGSGRVTAAGDGSIWINHTHVDWYYRGQRTEAYSDDKKRGFRTLQYVPDEQPPDTQWSTLPPALMRNTDLAFEWKGVDAWSRTHADNLQFSYRIDGGEWSPFRPSTELDLYEMRGGRHTIEVRSRDTDFNIDPTPLRAEFTVILPLWRQAWFIASLLAGLLFVIAVVTLFIRQRVRHLLEIEQVKLRFFTHLSHEIKTPLSLILGPVERLQNEISDGRHQHYLSLIKSNSQRLLFLVNQLLEFRKSQLNKLEYEPEEADFIPFARSCLAVFDGWTREKGQALTLETKLEDFIFPFPHEIFHKIIDNLVNNAIKYTPVGGRIIVHVAKRDRPGKPPMGVIEVEDNGHGIPASEQKAVFEPFYRSAVHDQIEEGSGIGLAFVKELVDSIHGTIELISPAYSADPEHPGCRFRVTFPIRMGKGVSSRVPKAADLSEQRPPDKAANETSGPSSSLILLVEDNHELREFISGELKGSFQIEAAEDAAGGFRKARELIPDLVITDVVMPGKSGFELCAKLKQEPHTSHIPVILLTALRSEKHKLKAYESGADDFITKPVSPEILRLKVRNLLATQLQSREMVRKQFVDDNRVTGISEADQAFLDKARDIVEQELSSEQFDVNALAEKMGYSRSAFYRKFNSLTALSPGAFIRTKRLRQAAQWLAKGEKSVSEIAYDLGFSDAGYFSRVFKDEYKCSPSEFAKNGTE